LNVLFSEIGIIQVSLSGAWAMKPEMGITSIGLTSE